MLLLPSLVLGEQVSMEQFQFKYDDIMGVRFWRYKPFERKLSELQDEFPTLSLVDNEELRKELYAIDKYRGRSGKNYYVVDGMSNHTSYDELPAYAAIKNSDFQQKLDLSSDAPSHLVTSKNSDFPYILGQAGLIVMGTGMLTTLVSGVMAISAEVGAGNEVPIEMESPEERNSRSSGGSSDSQSNSPAMNTFIVGFSMMMTGATAVVVSIPIYISRTTRDKDGGIVKVGTHNRNRVLKNIKLQIN
jgi:hypothetical protein